MRRADLYEGMCNICGGTYKKALMARHIESCIKEKSPSDCGNMKKGVKYRILVEGAYSPIYWLLIDIKANAKLSDLDSFLRLIWLECCFHMSAFKIHNVEYSSGMLDDSDVDIPLKKVLFPGLIFYYDYDFGTTTSLRLKVISAQEGLIYKRPVQLLARNLPPPIRCVICGKPATKVCSVCINYGKGWYCEECARSHKCCDEGDHFLPVVNSPRVGRCGYTGNI